MTVLDPSLFELFREEVRAHAATLSAGLLELEADPTNPTRIEPLMRAAHSIKGACRIANLDAGVRLAHVMEDAFVAAQAGKIRLSPADVDHLLNGTDLLTTLADLRPDTAADWDTSNAPVVTQLEPVFAGMAKGMKATALNTSPPVGEVVGTEGSGGWGRCKTVLSLALKLSPVPSPCDNRETTFSGDLWGPQVEHPEIEAD